MAIKEFGYEYDAILHDEIWKVTRGQVTTEKWRDAYCLRSGRDALKVVAREYPGATVLLPALACESMILPFEMYECKVIFYRYLNDYKIDIEYLRCIIPNQKTLLVYMDYFGNLSITDSELDKLHKEYGDLIFIEDRTHNLLEGNRREFKADYVIASLRKWVNIPDGGLLWSKMALSNTFFSADTSFSERRLMAQCMRREYLSAGDESIKCEYRKIFSTVSEILDGDKLPSRMSKYSYELLRKTDWNKIKKQREHNASILCDTLVSGKIDLIQNYVGYSDLYVAFYVPNRDCIQKKLSELGIFNTIIWPISKEQREVCCVAKETVDTMLAAPCDQRYTEEDMKYIGNEIVRIVNE